MLKGRDTEAGGQGKKNRHFGTHLGLEVQGLFGILFFDPYYQWKAGPWTRPEGKNTLSYQITVRIKID